MKNWYISKCHSLMYSIKEFSYHQGSGKQFEDVLKMWRLFFSTKTIQLKNHFLQQLQLFEIPRTRQHSCRCLRYHVPVNIAADIWDITYPSIATGVWDTLSICFKSYRYLRYVPYTSTAYIFDICTIYVLYLNSYKC